MSKNNVRTPRRVRYVAGLCALCFTGTFVLALPARVLSDEAALNRIQLAKPPAQPVHFPIPTRRFIPPPKSLRENLRPLTPQEAHKLQSAVRTRSVSHNISLLNNIGRLQAGLSQDRIAQWQSRLRPNANPQLTALQAARLQLAFGEARLAKDEEPLDAIAHFKAAIHFARAVQGTPGRSRQHRPQPASAQALAAAVLTTARRDIGFGGPGSQ